MHGRARWARRAASQRLKVDPGVRYPPYSQNQLQRLVVNKLMP